MNENYAELFDDDGESLGDGDHVRINGEFVSVLRLDGMGQFHLEGWPEDRIVPPWNWSDEPRPTKNRTGRCPHASGQ